MHVKGIQDSKYGLQDEHLEAQSEREKAWLSFVSFPIEVFCHKHTVTFVI